MDPFRIIRMYIYRYLLIGVIYELSAKQSVSIGLRYSNDNIAGGAMLRRAVG